MARWVSFRPSAAVWPLSVQARCGRFLPGRRAALAQAVGVALALHDGRAAGPLAAPGAPFGLAAQADDADAVVLAVVALAAIQALGARVAVAFVVVQAGPQRELARRQLDAGGRARHRAAHDEVDSDGRGAAKLGRAAAQYLGALQLLGGHAPHLGERKARVGRGALAVHEELHGSARHAPGARIHAAVGAMLARVYAGQLADQLAHGQAAQGADCIAVDDGFLRGGAALLVKRATFRVHGHLAQLAFGRALLALCAVPGGCQQQPGGTAVRRCMKRHFATK